VTPQPAPLCEILAGHDGTLGPLLPILHDVQARYGYVSEQAIEEIALHLNLSRAEVSGVVGFYHDFRRAPDPRPALKLCRAEACQARGSEELAAVAERLAAGRVRIETVYCLGLCSVGPAAMIDEQVHARLNRSTLATLLEQGA